MVRSIVAALLLVLATVAAPGAVLAQNSRDTTFVGVDEATGLDATAAIDEYESDGVATTEIGRVGMQVTVSKSAADAGLDTWKHLDAANTYIRLNYTESVPRTIRIYIPDEYATPRVKRGLDAETGGPTAALAPTDDRNYTAMTVTVDEPTTAVYKLNAVSGAVFEARSGVKEVINESVGIEVPRLGGGRQWQYVGSDQLSGDNVTRKLGEGSLSQYTIQYAVDDGNETDWLTVGECDGGGQVCALERDDSVYVFAPTESPPRVRYKRGQDLIARVGAAFDDLASIPSRLLEDLGGLWGGGS